MRIVIVGDGKVGLALTEMLSAEDHDITVVDSNPKVLAQTQEEFDAMVVAGHGASRKVLLEAGADEADVLIAATSMDEVNLLSCLVANKLGCSRTIARVRSPEYADDIGYLRQDLGLSFVINPEEACARELFHILQFPSFLQRDRFAKGRVEIVKIKVGQQSPLAGTPLFDLYNTAKVKVLVCAVGRRDDVTIPNGSFVIEAGDELYITAGAEDLAALIKNLGLASNKVTQITIVGGSRVALYLAHRLLKSGVGVKIIEKDPRRCLVLAELLPGADIVEGDGTQKEILLSEGICRSDALVALTGIDEENIVLSLFADEMGVAKTITKCNRSQYADMFQKLGIDSVVSPKQTTADEIVRYVRAMQNSAGDEMIAMHAIANEKAEALEFRAGPRAGVLGVPLAQLPIRPGILIACISRGSRTIIPSGTTVIEPGDSVVVVTASHRILQLDDVLVP